MQKMMPSSGYSLDKETLQKIQELKEIDKSSASAVIRKAIHCLHEISLNQRIIPFKEISRTR